MPERVHTKFTDDAEPESLSAGHVSKHHDAENNLKQTIPETKVSHLAKLQDLSPTQGVKRTRGGTPKSPSALKSTVRSTSPEEKENITDIEKPLGPIIEQANTDEKDKEIPTVHLKALSSPPHLFMNSSPKKRSASFGSTTSRGVSEAGRETQSVTRNGAFNHGVNGAVQRSPKSTWSNELKGASARLRPSTHALQRVRQDLLETRKVLPIWAHKSDIRWALRKSDVLLLVGETGSGKSTQVPQFLTSEPWFKRQTVKINENGIEKKFRVGGMVAITEPRRVAAISLAHRVAQETGSCLAKGQYYDTDSVGYSVRFDTVVPRKTNIKFLTEGMLLQELLHDPHLRNYSAVIIDEIHERSVDVDLLAGFLRMIVRGDRTGRGGVPLKLVIMSATANMVGIEKFFSVDPSSIATLVSPNLSEGSTKANGDSHEICNATEQRVQPCIKNNNSTGGIVPNPEKDLASGAIDHADRRVSDASYSSWDGITSEDETTEKQNGNVDQPFKAQSNGFHPLDSSSSLGLASHSSGKSRHGSAKPNESNVMIHYIKGRQHPVKILYTPEPVSDYIVAMLKTIFKIHTQEPLPGDILCFLTGQEEIESLRDLVEQYSEKLNKALPKIKVLCLYGHLSNEQQQEAFAGAKDKRTRKIVIATNIAETSVTVPGVRFVIDCGKAKIKQHRARLGLQSLLIKPISKSSAIQRKGRAGREAPGKCYRLYTESEYLKLPEADLPEILRSDVLEAVLRMKARGVQDVLAFPLLDPPDVDTMEKALFNLHSIGALDDKGELNDIGIKMANFPLPAAYSRVLIAAAEPQADCLLEAIDAIACITCSDDVFLQPKSDEKREEIEETRRDLLRREGDIITYLTAIQKYASENTNRADWCEKRLISFRDMKQAINIRRQLREMCLKLRMLAEKPAADPQPFIPMPPERAEVLLKCFMKAFATKSATLHPDGSYCMTVGKHVVAIHPSSVLHGKKMEAIMFLDHVYTQKNYARKVNAIQINWIVEALEVA